MNVSREIRVGLVGFGFIGKVHSLAYRNIPICFSKPAVVPRLAAVLTGHADVNREALSAAGVGLVTADAEHFFTEPLDIVDVCTPNHLHREVVEKALAAGRAVYCEKPLAHNLEDASRMVEQARAYGALTQVAFMFRFLPAVRQMKGIIANGEIGDVINFRAHFLHSSYLDSARPMAWRLRQAESGGGAFMDLAAHMVDLVHYLVGEVDTVRSLMRTWIAERHSGSSADGLERVEVDDWAHCMLEMKNGAVGSIEASRMSAGQGEAAGLEIYGRKGSVIFNMENPRQARVYDLASGEWRTGQGLPLATGEERPIEQVWVPAKMEQGFMNNAHMASAYSFVLDVAEGRHSMVDFSAGLAVQKVIDAAYRSAKNDGTPFRVAD